MNRKEIEMKLSILMAIKAFIVVIFRLSFVLLPTTMMSLFGTTLGPGGALITQLWHNLLAR